MAITVEEALKAKKEGEETLPQPEDATNQERPKISSNDSVNKTLAKIQEGIGDFLNQYNKTLLSFQKQAVLVVRRQNQELASIESILGKTKTAFKDLENRYRKLDSRLRNIEHIKPPPPIRRRPPPKPKRSSIVPSLIAGGIGVAALTAYWLAKNKDRDKDKKPEADATKVKPKSEIKWEGKHAIFESKSNILLDAINDIMFTAGNKIHFKADEIVLESDDITFATAGGVDPASADTVAIKMGGETTCNFECGAGDSKSIEDASPWEKGVNAAGEAAGEAGGGGGGEGSGLIPTMPDTIPELPGGGPAFGGPESILDPTNPFFGVPVDPTSLISGGGGTFGGGSSGGASGSWGDGPASTSTSSTSSSSPSSVPASSSPSKFSPLSTVEADASGIIDVSSQSGQGQRNVGKFGSNPIGMTIHHTGPISSVEGVIATFKERGYPAQFIIDRDGKIYRYLPEGSTGAHMKPGWGPKGTGLSNANMEGVEIMAANDRDVTPAQAAAAARLVGIRARMFGWDPKKGVFGHGEVNPGHKEADEGMTVVRGIREGTLSTDPPKPKEPAAAATGSAAEAEAQLNEDLIELGKRGQNPQPAYDVYNEKTKKSPGPQADASSTIKDDQFTIKGGGEVLSDADAEIAPGQQLAAAPKTATLQPSTEAPFTVTMTGMAASFSEGGVFKPGGLFGNYAQKAAQGMVDKLGPEKFAKLPPDVKAHVQAALAGTGNFDVNFVVRRTAPLMTRAELEKSKAELAEQGVVINEPKGYKAPDEREQKPPPAPPPAPAPDPAPKPPPPPTQTDTSKPAKPEDATPVDTDKPKPTIEPDKPKPTEEPDKPKPKEDAPKEEPKKEEKPQEKAGPATADPEREHAQPSSGSYGGGKATKDHNAGICMI